MKLKGCVYVHTHKNVCVHSHIYMKKALPTFPSNLVAKLFSQNLELEKSIEINGCEPALYH